MIRMDMGIVCNLNRHISNECVVELTPVRTLSLLVLHASPEGRVSADVHADL
jgi:hypothetical protein